MESLEERRLLSAVYSVQQFTPFPPGDDSARASVNGEAFLTTAGQLYRSDGSTAGTSSISAAGASPFYDWNGTVYFTASNGLFPTLSRLDPDAAGPVEIHDDHDLMLGPVADFAATDTALFFTAISRQFDRSGLYVTDGTSAGTHLVQTQVSSVVGSFGQDVLYVANTGSPLYRSSLWRTDGTAADTAMLKDDFPAGAGQELGGRLLFGGPGGLWASDGTVAGTVLLKAGPFPQEWHGVGDAAYFIDTESNLWKTDGTEAGTIPMGPAFTGWAGAVQHTSMANIGNTLFYAAPDQGKIVLLATQGPGTTRRIIDGGASAQLVTAGNKVVYVAINGITFSRSLVEVNPQTGETRVLPGYREHLNSDALPQNLFAVVGSVFFTGTGTDGWHHLWRYSVAPVAIDDQGVVVVSGADPAEDVPGDDQITITSAADRIDVDFNGSISSFPASSVRHITVNAVGGNDTLTVDGIPPAPLTFNGGGGRDTLNVRGTPGNDIFVFSDAPHVGPAGDIHASGVESTSIDLLGGDDRVTLLHPDTNPTVHGGDGNDSVFVDDRDRPLYLDYSISDAGVGRSSVDAPVAPVSTFDGFEDVALRAGAWANVITATPSATARLAVDGHTPPGPGLTSRDRLRIDAAGTAGIHHTAGAVPGSGQWTFSDRQPVSYTNVEQTDAGVPLTGDFTDVTPDPRKDPVAQVVLAFSEPVSGLELSDLRLTRDDNPANLLAADQTLTTADGGTTWTLGNLAPLTAADGRYVLTLAALGSGVVDAIGTPLAQDVTDTFSVDNAAPTASFADLSSPSVGALSLAYVTFSEPVNGFDGGDLTLTLNGGPNLLTGTPNLMQVDPRTYRLPDLSRFTPAGGQYVLSLARGQTSGITHPPGNPLAPGASLSFHARGRVLARQLFDNNSAHDGHTPGPDVRDAQAIDSDHRALLPGQTAGVYNY